MLHAVHRPGLTTGVPHESSPCARAKLPAQERRGNAAEAQAERWERLRVARIGQADRRLLTAGSFRADTLQWIPGGGARCCPYARGAASVTAGRSGPAANDCGSRDESFGRPRFLSGWVAGGGTLNGPPFIGLDDKRESRRRGRVQDPQRILHLRLRCVQPRPTRAMLRCLSSNVWRFMTPRELADR